VEHGSRQPMLAEYIVKKALPRMFDYIKKYPEVRDLPGLELMHKVLVVKDYPSTCSIMLFSMPA